MSTTIDQILALRGARPEGGAWPDSRTVRAYRTGTLLRVFGMTAAVAVAADVVERIVALHVVLWQAQLASDAVMAAAVTLAVFFSLRRQFDALRGAGTQETARRQAEAERQALASALDQAAESVLMTDAHGRIEYVNASFTRATGYSAAEAIGQNPRLLKSGRQDERYYRNLWQTIAAGKTWRGTLLNRRKDGSLYTEEMQITPVRDSGGNITSYIAIKQDVTERRAAEEARNFLASIVEATDDAVVGRDLDGVIISWNRGAEALYGYRAEEVLGKNVTMLVGPERRAHLLELADRLHRGESIHPFESVGVKKDGTSIAIFLNVFPTRNSRGEVVAGAAIIRDITDRKRAYELVEHLQRRNELILDSAGEGILGLDCDAGVTFANAAAARMLGLDSAALIGQQMHDLVKHTRPDGTTCSPESCAIHASIRNGMERHSSQDMFRNAGGGTFPVEFTRTPKFENGRAAGAVVVFRDITESKLAQERLEASLREKEALLREIHHRVKNNLQVVCSLLSLQSRTLKDVQAKRVFEGTRQRVKAMALVHEALYQSADLAGIDFSAYVSRLVPQLMHAYGLPPESVRLRLDIESVVLPIDVAIPCALMLTELVSNSLKHVFAAARGGELRIAFRRIAEPSWLLEVQNPCGPEAAAGTPRAGASFGLRLVQLLTEQLDGTVNIESTPDFRVRVVFPAVAGAAAAIPAEERRNEHADLRG